MALAFLLNGRKVRALALTKHAQTQTRTGDTRDTLVMGHAIGDELWRSVHHFLPSDLTMAGAGGAYAYIPTFDPSVLLTLKFRGRSVVVPRNRCSDYDSVITVAQRNVRNLRSFAEEDLVLLALIPGYTDKKEVEVSKEAWPLVSAVVQSVTIASNQRRILTNPFCYFSTELRSSADSEYGSGSTVTSS
ncbi:hypothetical protein BGY98DRAFT_1000682, partial [Russula aff. rugulosa BPL654]